MNVRHLIVALGVLAFIGIADSLYLSFAHATGSALSCGGVLDGCNTVAQSPYSKLLGIPLAYLGVLYYAGLAVLVGLYWPDARVSRFIRTSALAYAALGALMSAWFMYVQIALIGAVCIYCLISAITTLLTLIVVWFIYSRAPHE